MERGKREREWKEANVNWGFERVCKLPASYQQVRERGVARWGIKVEFGGFIGGFGKIFFTKGGDKEGKRGFLGGGEEGREEREFIFFLKIFKGVGKSSKFYGGMYF